MNRNTITVIGALIAPLFILSTLFSTACAATQPSKQAGKTPPVPAVLTVTDIVGKREWKPSEESSLICATEDPKGGDLTYTWSAEKGSIKGEGQTVSWTAPDSLGDYGITVKVASSKGGETTFTKKFKVTDNPYHNNTADKTIYLNLTIPSANPVSKTSRLRIFTTAEIQCVVDGYGPADITYTWTAPTGKMLGEDIASGKDSKIGWIAPGQGGFYTVSVVATDKAGRQAKGEVVFEALCCRDP
jgi:hypothetical protein